MLMLLGILLFIIAIGASTPATMATYMTGGVACLVWAYIREY